MSINVPIFVESRYKINRKKIKERVKAVVEKQGVISPIEVSIAIVGNRKMRELNKKYRNIDKPTNVLSFPQSEPFEGPQGKVESVLPPEGKLYLGDVVISYPVVIEEAARYNKLVDDWTCELVEHGLQHLFGLHHE